MDNQDNNEPEVDSSAEESNVEVDAFDDLGVDIPDIPLPMEDEAEQPIEDEFESAYKFAIVGVGQGGSRLAETFWKLGYRRCLLYTSPSPRD